MAVRIETVVGAFTQTIDLLAEPRPAEHWLIDLGIEQGWIETRAEAGEWAERVRERFLDRLRREYSAFVAVGRPCPFEFNSSSDYMLQGAAFEEPGDSHQTREAKRRRARLPDYEGALRGLNPEEFESVCAGMLKMLGVRDPRLTPRSGDEGIDFYGYLELEQFILPGDLYPTIQKQLVAWMIGQAKRYLTTGVSTPDVRELVGSIQLAKGRAYVGTSDKYRDLVIRACDPVFYLFFTTGRLSSESWNLLAQSGVVGMDGQMVASFLADREVGVEDGEFDEDIFRRWIGENRA